MGAASELGELLSKTKNLRVGRDGPLATNVLGIVRRAPIYDPDLPLNIGGVARRHLSADSVEYWDIVEQIVQAAADRGVWAVFAHVGNELRERFPDSWRVDTLVGRRDEALGDWDAALRRYISVTEKDPLRGAAYKRQIAVLKAQRKVPEAVALLNHYVGLFSGDAEAWGELCSLSMALGRLEHALFAANELVVINPDNFAAHILVADIHMTMGGFQNFLSARRHFSYSLSIRGRAKSMRALYGLWMAATYLQAENNWKESMYSDGITALDRENAGDDAGTDSGKGDSKGGAPRKQVLTAKEKREENDRVIEWAREAIHAMYTSIGKKQDDLSRKGSDAERDARSSAHMLSVVSNALGPKS